MIHHVWKEQPVSCSDSKISNAKASMADGEIGALGKLTQLVKSNSFLKLYKLSEVSLQVLEVFDLAFRCFQFPQKAASR